MLFCFPFALHCLLILRSTTPPNYGCAEFVSSREYCALNECASAFSIYSNCTVFVMSYAADFSYIHSITRKSDVLLCCHLCMCLCLCSAIVPVPGPHVPHIRVFISPLSCTWVRMCGALTTVPYRTLPIFVFCSCSPHLLYKSFICASLWPAKRYKRIRYLISSKVTFESLFFSYDGGSAPVDENLRFLDELKAAGAK